MGGATSKPRSWLIAQLPRWYRLSVLFLAAGLLYFSARNRQTHDSVSLADAQQFFPTAVQFADDPRWGGRIVLDQRGQPLGTLLTTSPHADEIIGYTGPNNLLIALDLQPRIIGAKLLASGDTAAHVEQVARRTSFWEQFNGQDPTERKSSIEAVSGSTLTSLAIAEALDRRLRGPGLSLRFPEPVTLEEIQQLFPAAKSFAADRPLAGWHEVRDSKQQRIGYAVRTSPSSDNGRGYRGPTETLLAVDTNRQRILNLKLRKSYDTEEYVARLRDDPSLVKQLTQPTLADWPELDFAAAGIEGVSGATQTSFAVAEGIKRRVTDDRAAFAAKSHWKFHPGLVFVIAGALAMTFSPLRANRRLRSIWQAILIVLFAIWLGDLLSLSLLAGWGRNGLPWQTAPVVIVLAAVAIFTPWSSRRQIYCDQICPHGAAQTWLGRFKSWQIALPAKLQDKLVRLPAVLLAIGFVLAVFVPTFDLAQLEPFDGWVLKSGAFVSLLVGLIGLLASLFIPQAYCRFGCPTGELLQLVKSGGNFDRFRAADGWAGGLVVMVALAWLANEYRTQSALSASAIALSSAAKPTTILHGQVFGTTWSVRLRGEHDEQERNRLQRAVANELTQIENRLSHWKPDSFTSQFNAAETTFASEQPEELLELVTLGMKLNQATGGAYDLTVAPLADAWGFGPSGPNDAPPTEEELAQLLARVGSDKLKLDTAEKTLQKIHPQLQLDLGSLLQGYAADRLAKLLTREEVTEFLIDVGGELFARGSWQVAIEDPRGSSTPLRLLELRDQALATSGLYRAKRILAAGTAHHLISPQTGRPLPTDVVLAAVIAPTAVEADGWATALLAVGVERALTLADDQSLSVLIVGNDQEVRGNSRGVFSSVP